MRLIITLNLRRTYFGFACLAAVCLTTLASDKAISGAADVNGRVSVAALSPEVRLRKLHLVRPDLIPYPLAYEMYC